MKARYLLPKRIVLSLLLILTTLSVSNAQQAGIQFEGLKEINGTRLYVKIIGKGEPLVIVHGGPVLDHSYLLPWLKPLAKQYKLVFFDQRLSGRSTAEVDSGSVRLENFVADIEGIRKAFKLGDIHVAGHSWGGLLAMRYAIDYPEHLKSLVLMNPMPPSSALWQQENAALAAKATVQDSLDRQEVMQSGQLQNDYPGAVQKLLRISFRSQFYNPSLADSLHFYIPADHALRSRRFGAILPDISDYNLLPELKQLQVPTLIIYGAIEPAADLSGPALEKTIPDAQLVIVPRSGHFPFVEQPEAFFKTVTSFLKKRN